MTEKQQLEAMLQHCRVRYSDVQDSDGGSTVTIHVPWSSPRDTEPIVGYASFYTEWKFDKNGVLVQVGVWE